MLMPDPKIPSVALLLVMLTACNSISDAISDSLSDSIPESTVAEEVGRHLSVTDVQPSAEIPQIVRPLPVITQPQSDTALDLYTVVVQDVAVRELLFAMARDASLNIDVHSDVDGLVSINAIDQTLPQILDRISRQIAIRWHFEGADYLIVQPDVPVLRSYRVDYVNIARTSLSEVSVSSAVTGSIGTGGGGSDDNNSATILTQISSNEFWSRLETNLKLILGDQESGAGTVMVSPESGLVTVRATSKQHEEVFEFIEMVQTRALYQVLIEATVVEVSLNDSFQAGVDWSILDVNSTVINFTQQLTGLNLNSSPTNVLTIDHDSGPDAINATIRLLAQFGDTRILSSPKLMALNNQTAMLRVVDNKVYFTIEVEAGIAATATSPLIPPTFTSEVHTVPVGFTMSVTPQISDNNQVTLNVRPTISRIVRFVDDPNPALAEADVVNSIPEIQIREIESILKVESGQIAVLGGLMQDTLESTVDALPGLHRLPFIGHFFKYQSESTVKTELIIFIRPLVMRQASINADLESYRNYLPSSSSRPAPRQNSLLFN